MKLQPRNNQVLVRVTKERKNDGLSEAEVVAVGPGNWANSGAFREDIGLKPGDRVLVNNNLYDADRVVGMKGKNYLIIEHTIVAVILPDGS